MRYRGQVGIVVVLVLVVVSLLVGLRVVALDSDAYRGLSWDTGLFTDEGYYTHNARNAVLYGTERTDEFNNRLLMPLIHQVQLGVFKAFGYGAVQARLISVVFSLLTLVVFWFALARSLSVEVATVGTLFLGLDHTVLLYNRMALMDTPAAFVMVCTFYLFVLLAEEVDSERLAGNGRLGRLSVACGVLLGLIYATRGLAAFMLPAPLVALWLCRKENYRFQGSFWFLLGRIALGLFLLLCLYFVFWYYPNRDALTHTNRYHIGFQLLPHSLSHLWRNVWQGVHGQNFLGLAPYLSRYAPVQFFLCLSVFVGWKAIGRMDDKGRFGVRIVAVWLLLGWLLFLCVNYAPSRYYVLVYPAFSAVAAVGLVNFKDFWEEVSAQRLWRAILGAFLGLQVAGMLRLYAPMPESMLYLIGTGGGYAIGLLMPSSIGYDRQTLWGWNRFSSLLCLVWVFVNGFWLWDWWSNRTYTHRDASVWLGENLPADSILIGDCAPGLCFYNRLRCVNVIPDLCNDTKPYERFAPAPRYITILDEGYKEKWWVEHYPEQVSPERRLRLFSPLVSHPVGVYQ
jgi:4-amino-4-deoxy-L-arabinose transferase-like glycosyltransferase